jgi:hypothetical protein
MRQQADVKPPEAATGPGDNSADYREKQNRLETSRFYRAGISVQVAGLSVAGGSGFF